jgi:periplasmic copper chaperone A
MSRKNLLASSFTFGAVSLMAVSALAHVTLEVREAKAGAPYKATLRVPHGCDGTATLKVRAQIPEGVIAVKPMPKPGWQLETVKGKYDKSYPYYHGQQLTEGVREIVWSGGKLPDEHYDEFVFAGFLAGDLKPGPIYIPVTQECETGEARWADIPAPGQDRHALRAPAPALIILAQHSQHGGGHAAMANSKVYKAGSLTIEAPWARATPGGAKVAGGYMKITNNGKEPDRLIGGTVPFAGRFEVHEMAVEGGIMKMRELSKGLEIKPGQTVELKPGGYHVMFMELKQGLKEGESIKGTLVFEKAGKVDVEYKVGPIGGGAPAGGSGGGHSHH